PAPAALLDQHPVRERGLRILVERLQVRRRRCGVEVVVELLDVLAVVAFGPGEPEEPLLEDRIAPVPERQRQRDAALPVADPEQPVLAPAVRAAARVVVRKRLPGRPVRRVVLPDRAPLPLGQVGAPALPVLLTASVLDEALLLAHGPCD